MSDGSAAAALEGLGGEQQGGEQQGQQSGEQQGQQVGEQQGAEIGDWLKDLPEELRSDPDINRYKTAEDAAKGIKETRAWARGRIPLPAADDEAGWTELGQKLRPEKAEDYEIPLPDGDTGELAGAFKTLAHEIGLPPRWAKRVAEFHNQAQADAVSRLTQGNDDELKALEIEYGAGAYNQRLEAVGNMVKALGFDSFEPVTALQHALESSGKPGAGQAMRLLFAMAEKTGELGKVDADSVLLRMGAVSPEDAAAKARAMVENPELTKALADPESPERKRYEALMAQSKR